MPFTVSRGMLAASAHDGCDRVDVRDGAPPRHAYAQLRVVSNLPRSGIKLIEEAKKVSRCINGPEQIKLLLQGIAFRDGYPVQDGRLVQQKLAA